MKIDNTELLEVLKRPHPQPKEPTDEKKIEGANELHDRPHGLKPEDNAQD